MWLSFVLTIFSLHIPNETDLKSSITLSWLQASSCLPKIRRPSFSYQSFANLASMTLASPTLDSPTKGSPTSVFYRSTLLLTVTH